MRAKHMPISGELTQNSLFSVFFTLKPTERQQNECVFWFSKFKKKFENWTVQKYMDPLVWLQWLQSEVFHKVNACVDLLYLPTRIWWFLISCESCPISTIIDGISQPFRDLKSCIDTTLKLLKLLRTRTNLMVCVSTRRQSIVTRKSCAQLLAAVRTTNTMCA